MPIEKRALGCRKKMPMHDAAQMSTMVPFLSSTAFMKAQIMPGRTAKPARFGNIGPYVKRPQGKTARDMHATTATAGIGFLLGNRLTSSASMETGNTMNENVKSTALMARGADTPHSMDTSAHTICQPLG